MRARWQRNILSVRLAILEAELDILLPTPDMRYTEEYILWVRVRKARSRRMGPAAVAEMTLPRLDHPCAAALFTAVRMCAKGAILGAKSWTWSKREASSRLLMVTSLVGLVSLTSSACVALEKGDCQTNHWHLESWQTPPIHDLDASVAPSHVRGKGSIF